MSKFAVFQILSVFFALFFALKRSIFLGFFLDQIQNKHKYGNIGNKRLTSSKTIFILNENSVIALWFNSDTARNKDSNDSTLLLKLRGDGDGEGR